MSFYIINRLWRTLLLLSVAAGGARAQWTEVAPNLVGPESQRIGAICFSHGVAWAGATALFSSTDTGKTWNVSSSFPALTVFPTDGISDIAFYDSLNGLVGTYASGVFLTQDGGQSWNTVIRSSREPDCRVAFNGSASVMHDVNNSGVFSTSTDGGNSWSTQNFGGEGLTFAIGADKTIYVFTSGTTGWVNYSTDLGQTWSGNETGTDADSQGLAADSCNINKLYLINENTRDRTNNKAKIDVSPDGGQTWQTNSSHQLDYYSGSIANTAQVIYITTVPTSGSGVLRSTDQGASWKSVGGPTTCFDTRSIALANNNIVFVLDSNGSIWLTKNSGGDSLTFPAQLVLANDRVQIAGTACSPSDTGIILNVKVPSCAPLSAELDSLWITGSGAWTRSCDCPPTPLLLSGADSIPLRFWPGVSGSDTAELHLALTLGNVNLDTTIQLIGRSVSASSANPTVTHRENASAYVGEFDSLTLGVDVSSEINLDSLWPSLTDIQASYTWDSSVVSYASYLPPDGWSVTSITPRGNAVDIAIHNVSSSASSPLNLGTAVFQPNQNQLATSWVELSRLGLFADGQSIGICVTDNEDHHWAVQTLGAQSAVAEVPSTDRDISVYPNPADGKVWITSTNDLGEVTVEIYDMLGVQQGTQSTTMSKNNPVELLLPVRSGVYAIMVRSIAGTRTLRVVQEH
jgi:hypothetical protein